MMMMIMMVRRMGGTVLSADSASAGRQHVWTVSVFPLLWQEGQDLRALGGGGG